MKSEGLSSKSKIMSGDIIVIAVCLAIAAVMLTIQVTNVAAGKLYAEIYREGALIETAELDADRILQYDNVTLAVSGGTIAFVESDCPDKICVHTGKLEKAGDIAVCVPNKLSVVIKSHGIANDKGITEVEGGIDAITY